MRSGLLGQMNNPSTNGVNGHLPGDALAAGRLPGNVNQNGLSDIQGFSDMMMEYLAVEQV